MENFRLPIAAFGLAFIIVVVVFLQSLFDFTAHKR